MIRGTRRPGGAGRTTGGRGGGDMGDSLGPGEGCFNPVVQFFKAALLIALVGAVCLGCSIIIGGQR